MVAQPLPDAGPLGLSSGLHTGRPGRLSDAHSSPFTVCFCSRDTFAF